MGRLELRIPPTIVAIIVGVGMRILTRPGPAVDVPLAWRSALFAAFVLAGVAAAYAGGVAFRHARTTVSPLKPQDASTLVTGGIYRFTRNPMYVGMAGLLVANALRRGSWPAVLPIAAFVAVIDRFQIAAEERALAERFGPDYATYRSAVPRWVGVRSFSR